MNIHIHVHHHNHGDAEIKEKLNLIIKNQEQMATSVADLSAKVDTLQTALDEEQAQVRQAIEELQATVNELRAGGGTDAEREALAAKIDNVITDLKGTIPDAPTEPTEPTTPTV